VPRWLAHLLVVVGWLLTPAWAWAASQVGLWLGALIALRFESPIVMMSIAGIGALLFGFLVLWVWVRFMRRLPHLLSHHMAPRASEEHAAIAAAD
jgi:FtsH-binding integral membrane protein